MYICFQKLEVVQKQCLVSGNKEKYAVIEVFLVIISGISQMLLRLSRI